MATIKLKALSGGSVSLVAGDTASDVVFTIPPTTSTIVTSDVLAASTGSGLVGANAYQTQDGVNKEHVSVKRFGAVGNGVADDTAAIQAAATEAALLKMGLYLPFGTYKITAPIVLSGTVAAWQIYGDGCGDAYSDSSVAASQIYAVGCDVFQVTATSSVSSISIEKLRHRNTGTDALGYLLNLSYEHQIKQLWMTEVTGNDTAGLLRCYSVGQVNAPYITITRAYTWSTDKIVFMDNTPSTIFTVNDGLFHSTANHGLHFGIGGEVSLMNTWFESCSPSVLYKPTTNFFKVALHNVFFENKGSETDPTKTAWNCGTNTELTLTGKTNFAFMADAPSTLNGLSRIWNYTQASIPILCNSGQIMTPDTVSLYAGVGYKHIAFVPVKEGVKFNDNLNKDAMPSSVAGIFLNTVDYSSAMPSDLQNIYAPTTPGLVRGAIEDQSTSASARLLCMSFLYKSASTNNGFSTAYFTVDGAAQSFTTGFVFPNNITINYYCVVACDLPANAVPQFAWFSLRNAVWNSFGHTFCSDRFNVSSLLPFKGRTKQYSVSIADASNTNFILNGTSALAYRVQTEFVVNNGNKGTYKLDSHGTVNNANKNRYVTNQVTGAGIAFTDNSAVTTANYFAVNVANTTGAAITVNFKVKY